MTCSSKDKRNGLDDVPADVRAQMDALDTQEADAVKEQKMMAQPKPHRVEPDPGTIENKESK